MKFNLLFTLILALTSSVSAYADTWCTIKARNTHLTKHEHKSEVKGLSLTECVSLAEREYGRVGVFNTKMGSFDVDYVQYSYMDADTRAESKRVVEGVINHTDNASTTEEPTYKPKRDRCGGLE